MEKEALERDSNGHKNQNDFSSNSDFKHRNPGRNNQSAAVGEK